MPAWTSKKRSLQRFLSGVRRAQERINVLQSKRMSPSGGSSDGSSDVSLITIGYYCRTSKLDHLSARSVTLKDESLIPDLFDPLPPSTVLLVNCAEAKFVHHAL